MKSFCLIVVVAAVNAYGTEEEALNYLVTGQDPNRTAAVAAANGNTNPSQPLPNNGGADGLSAEVGSSGILADDSNVGQSSRMNEVEERDVEMEDEITADIQGVDALSDYDIEIAKEGEAINEYLTLLLSAQNVETVTASSQ